MRHTTVTVKLSPTLTRPLESGRDKTVLGKPVPASRGGREATARGLAALCPDQQGPEAKATQGMCSTASLEPSTPRMWSETLLAQRWEPLLVPEWGRGGQDAPLTWGKPGTWENREEGFVRAPF